MRHTKKLFFIPNSQSVFFVLDESCERFLSTKNANKTAPGETLGLFIF